MNEKSILSLLVGQGMFTGKELKEVASKAFNPKFLKEFDELGIKLPDDTRENERFSDEGDEQTSEIDITHEEEERIEAERLKTKYRDLNKSQGVSKANPFSKNRLEDEDYENEEDYDQASRQTKLIIPKLKEMKPNPWEKLTCEQILVTVGIEKGRSVYKLTDLYLPTTPELRGNVFKYLYKHLIRNPKDILRMHRQKQQETAEQEEKTLKMFKIMYHQVFKTNKQQISAKQPEANITVIKDNIRSPITSYSNDLVFSPLNSAEWFNSLHHDLMRGIHSECDVEVEKDHLHAGAKEEEKREEPQPTITWAHHNGMTIEPIKGNGRITTLESSTRRHANSYGGNLAELFGDTPQRDNEEGSEGSRSKSPAHPFGNDTPRSESEGNFEGYNRALNQNMRQYLNDNYYKKERAALFGFYAGIKGHDGEHGKLWGESNSLSGSGESENNENKSKYDYLILPFNNEKERAIFKYQTDMQDASEMEMVLLHKKRRVGKHEEVKMKVGLTDNMYYNKNVLEATWNDFFLKPKPKTQREREYSCIVIDLNDKSIFYDKVHPVIFGVQRPSRRTISAFEEVPDQANAEEARGVEESKDMVQVGALDSSYVGPGTGFGGRPPAPSESEVTKPNILDINKKKSKREKQLRIRMAKEGVDPLTGNAQPDPSSGVVKPERPEHVELPPILKLVNDLKRKIPASSSAVIEHSKVAEDFLFNEFHIQMPNFIQFHRPDLRKLIEKEKPQPWRVEIVRQEEEKKEQDVMTFDDPFGMNEKVHSFEYFKNHKRLSLRDGKFALFEYMEENPLIISNVGMGSRLNRYLYPKRVQAYLGQKQGNNGNPEVAEFVKMIKEKLGPNGSITFLEENQNLPLIGQLTDKRFIGVSIMENNMFYAPIFIHKAPETDFVLVRYQSSDGSKRYFLRKIEYIYTVGQIEPKVEVFNPGSRSLTSFLRKSIKHIVQKKFANNEPVHLEEMKQLFRTFNDTNLKKIIQLCGGVPRPDDTKCFDYNKEAEHEHEDDPQKIEGYITPEEVCQYERMHASKVRLKTVGFEELESCDKINTIRNKYINRNSQKIWDETIDPKDKRRYAKMNIVGNYCSEELQLTAWNLSQSFLNSKQKQGRMQLKGFGDPTGGNGGYSYVKLPLKTSRYEKDEKKNNAQKVSQIAGNADLRKLQKEEVDKMIKKYGNYNIKGLARWDKIELLRQIANEHPEDEELAKYARTMRLTTQGQREKYQKDINELFMRFVDTMSKEGREHIHSEDDGEFEYFAEDLIDREIEERLKKKPKDKEQGDEQQSGQSGMEDEKGEDDENDMGDGDE